MTVMERFLWSCFTLHSALCDHALIGALGHFLAIAGQARSNTSPQLENNLTKNEEMAHLFDSREYCEKLNKYISYKRPRNNNHDLLSHRVDTTRKCLKIQGKGQRMNQPHTRARNLLNFRLSGWWRLIIRPWVIPSLTNTLSECKASTNLTSYSALVDTGHLKKLECLLDNYGLFPTQQAAETG